MNLDNHTMEVAYIVLVIASWTFTMSQMKYAWQHGTGWRWSVVFWLLSKSCFLTTAGCIWWFNWASPRLLETTIGLFALAHIDVRVHWLLLNDKGDGLDGLPTPRSP